MLKKSIVLILVLILIFLLISCDSTNPYIYTDNELETFIIGGRKIEKIIEIEDFEKEDLLLEFPYPTIDMEGYRNSRDRMKPIPQGNTTERRTTETTTTATTTTATTTTATTTTATTTTQKETTPASLSPTSTVTTHVPSGNFLLNCHKPDLNYKGRIVKVEDRAVLEGLVMGEFGTSFTGAVLVAQAIRDTMVLTGSYNTAKIAREWGYSAKVRTDVSQTVKDAVSYVFDQGGSAVQHSIYYFYASHLIYSSWHETQRFVVEYGGCRFFSRNR